MNENVWDVWVGVQTPAEFMELSPGLSPREAAEKYVREGIVGQETFRLPGQTSAEYAASIPANLAELLAEEIESRKEVQ